MNKAAIISLIKRLAKTAGIPRLHPHLLRHTYATSFLLNGGDVFLLKQNLGHSTLAMVEHYRHIASREAALLSETFSPLDRMNLKELRRNRRIRNNDGPVYPNAGFQRRLDHDGKANLVIESGKSIKNQLRLPRCQFHPSSSEGHNRRKG